MVRSAVAALLLCAVGASSSVFARPSFAPPPSVLALGSYERDALRQALAARGLALERAPAGKTVRRVHVVNLPVFGPAEGFLRWFNRFHITTREDVIAREVLVRPGEIWDEARVAETRRRLRDPLFTTLVVVEPVVAAGGSPAEVDLLVVTRDIWSLRMNSRYEVQERVLTELSLSLSENNLFGYRKQVALVFDMDLGVYTIGPQYVDKNIAGSHLTLTSKVDAVFNRYSSELEGSKSFTSFFYPLWSLEREWAGGIEVTHFDAVRRSFFGTGLRGYQTEQGVVLPWEYDQRDLDTDASVTRQLGTSVKHRFALGHRIDVTRPSLRDGFPGDAEAQAEFVREVLPRSERASLLFARYSMFTPVYAVYRNIDSFDLAEDQRLGPELVAEGGAALEVIGSEEDFLFGSLSAAWALDLAGSGLVRAAAAASARRQGDALIDISRSASVVAASPPFLGMRLSARAAWARRTEETNNRYFTIGGDSGLRGYTIAAFAGVGEHPVRVVGNLELRTLAVPIWFSRAGAVLFYDVGDAADCYRGCPNDLVLHQDVGVGGRMLIPQLQPYVFRFDWAIPLTGPTAGFPGRFIAGVNQVF